MLENKNISTCEFAVAMVSYIYDEIEGADRARFEDHLSECAPCADELTAFLSARTSIQEWRTEEFVPMAPPEISIPYQKGSNSVDDTVPRSWIESISQIFTLSPAWTTGAAALATLAICVGLFLAMYGSLPEPDEVRVQQPKAPQIRVSPSSSGNVEDSNSNISGSPRSGERRDVSPKISSADSDPSGPVTTGSKPNSARTRNVLVKKTSPVPSATDRAPATQNNKKIPRLVDDEDEVDSLRLSDLLEEIGMLK